MFCVEINQFNSLIHAMAECKHSKYRNYAGSTETQNYIVKNVMFTCTIILGTYDLVRWLHKFSLKQGS